MKKRDKITLVMIVFIIFFPTYFYTIVLDSTYLAAGKMFKESYEGSSINLDMMWYSATVDYYQYYNIQPAFGDIDGDGHGEIIVPIEIGQAKYLACLDGDTGKIIWTLKSHYRFIYQPLIIDANFDGIKEVVAGDEGGNLYLIYGLSGLPIWLITVKGAIRTPIIPYMIGSKLYFTFGTTDGVYSVDTLGKLNWFYITNSSIQDMTVGDINNDDILDVIVITYDFIMYTLDGDSGQIIWLKKLDDNSILDYFIGNIYFGDFDRDGSPNILVAWRNKGSLGVESLNASNGIVIWDTFIRGRRVDGVICDINGDNRLEFVEISFSNEINIVKLDDGSSSRFMVEGFTKVRSIVVGNFDSDPDLEIFAPPLIIDNVGGIWVARSYSIFLFPDGDPFYAFVFDIDGDGNLELFAIFKDIDRSLIAVKLTPNIPYRVFWDGLNGDVNGSKSLAYIDPDGDGLATGEELHFGTNPHSKDSDSDGMPDGWEIYYGLEPTDSSDASLDLDRDGLIDIEEFSHGSNPFVVDTDNDGLSDGLEVSMLLNPSNPGDPLYTWFLLGSLVLILAWSHRNGVLLSLKKAFEVDKQRFREYRKHKKEEARRELERKAKERKEAQRKYVEPVRLY